MVLFQLSKAAKDSFRLGSAVNEDDEVPRRLNVLGAADESDAETVPDEGKIGVLALQIDRRVQVAPSAIHEVLPRDGEAVWCTAPFQRLSLSNDHGGLAIRIMAKVFDHASVEEDGFAKVLIFVLEAAFVGVGSGYAGQSGARDRCR